MADYRLISQDYAKEALKACMLINGGAAVGILSQVDKLLLYLFWQAKWALSCWAIGLVFAATGWIFGFCSTRYVDKAQQETDGADGHIRVSNGLMKIRGGAVAVSVFAFAVGCILLACGF